MKEEKWKKSKKMRKRKKKKLEGIQHQFKVNPLNRLNIKPIILFLILFCLTAYKVNGMSIKDTSLINKQLIDFLVSENELDTTVSTPLGYFSFEVVTRNHILEDKTNIGIFRLSSQYSHSWSYIVLKNKEHLEFLTLNNSFKQDFNKVIVFIEKHNLYTKKELMKCLKTLVKDYLNNQNLYEHVPPSLD